MTPPRPGSTPSRMRGLFPARQISRVSRAARATGAEPHFARRPGGSNRTLRPTGVSGLDKFIKAFERLAAIRLCQTGVKCHGRSASDRHLTQDTPWKQVSDTCPASLSEAVRWRGRALCAGSGRRGIGGEWPWAGIGQPVEVPRGARPPGGRCNTCVARFMPAKYLFVVISMIRCKSARPSRQRRADFQRRTSGATEAVGRCAAGRVPRLYSAHWGQASTTAQGHLDHFPNRTERPLRPTDRTSVNRATKVRFEPKLNIRHFGNRS